DFSVQLSAPTNATLGDSVQVATIVDDGRNLPGGPANDDRPVFNMGSDFVVDEAAGTISFTVTKSGASELPATVNFTTVDGTALAGSDYTASSGTLSFAAGETSKTITVAITNDSLFEGAQDFSVQLSTPSNATLGDSIQVATIVDDGRNLPGGPADDDHPVVASVSSPSIDEGGFLVFDVVLSNASNVNTNVTLSLQEGSALRNVDWSSIAGVVIGGSTAAFSPVIAVPPGLTSFQVRVPTADDALDEIDETMTLSASTAQNLAPVVGTGTIIDNDATPSFSINDVTVNEGAGTATFTVALSAASGLATSVNWGLANGTALAGSDFTNNSGTLNFAPGVTTQTITVAILNDSPRVYEGAEAFSVNLSGAVNATIADSQGVGTIMDDGTGSGGSDNDRPTLSIDSPNVGEGGYATFTATLSNASTTAVTFTTSLSNGTAGVGIDTAVAGALQVFDGTSWVSASAGVTIPAGSTSVQLRLQTTDDLLDEVNETFTLNATVTSGNTANAAASGMATIVDNDTTPTVGNASASVSEEGLVGGIADTTGDSDTTNLRTVSGSIPVADADGNALSLTLSAPTAALTAQGLAVTWSGTGTQTLIGSAGGGEVLRVTIDNAGQYTVTLSKPLDHPLSSQEDVLGFDIGVTASDGVQSGSGTLAITIEDDMPNAIPGAQTVVVPAQDSNVMLILDISGSMGSGAGSKLQIMKDSVTTMLDQYDNLGDVMVRIVTFSSSANVYQNAWVSVSTAKAYVNGLGSGGSTNYDAALLNAMSAFNSTGKIAGAQNVSYFLTDGEPTASTDWNSWGYSGSLPNSNGIQVFNGATATEEGIWRNFLETNQINSFAYGMGTGATQSNMNPVAYNGVSGTDANAIVVANVTDLPPILRDSIIAPAGGDLLNGSLVAGSGIGADGGNLASFSLNGTTYSNGGAVSGTSRGTYDAATNAWTVATTAGGKFVVDMDNGQYTYTPPASTAAQYSEAIGYTLLDSDGDMSSSTLTINVLPPQVITLSSSTTAISGLNLGLSGEYFGYNDTRDGTAADPAYQGTTAVRLHADDGSADAGTANNVDRLADVEAIIEGRNNNANLINNAILADPAKADATFSANKLEFGLTAGTSTSLFSNDLGQNGKVTGGGTVGASATVGGANNLYTFLKVSSGNADNLAATSGLGDTTDAIIRMVGYIYIPAGGTYDLRVTADDGYRILIGGQNVAQLDQIQSTATNVYSGQVLSEGLQPIEILYWDQGGHATLRLELKTSGAADSSYKIIGTDEFALFSPSDVPTLTANQDIVESSTNGAWDVRTGESYTGSAAAEKVIGSDGRDTINAGDGNDIVQAGGGSDTILGGAGSDLLTGGLGSDTFAWTLADQGTAGAPARDTVTDFSVASKAAGGDVLDLRDLLLGENHATGTGNLTDFLHFGRSGSDTVIDIKPSGAGGSVTQQIVVSGVDLTAGNTLNDQAIIQDLLTKGKLLTD
ncbi:MAG: type I secretion C-terminal target domain-containing protein, partial [Dechloromonas sp.]|nr:type I secretion C-terminal target domain-containing protein [Dechloromonas sp.]